MHIYIERESKYVSQVTTFVIRERKEFSVLPLYVVISYFKLMSLTIIQPPSYVLCPPLPWGTLAFSVSTTWARIFRVISPLSLFDTRLNMFSSLTSSSRVLFFKTFNHVCCSPLRFSRSFTMREFVSNCITHEQELQQGKRGRPALNAHVALHAVRALALIMGWLWMLFYNLAPKDQEEKIQ